MSLSRYDAVKRQLLTCQKTWLLTGVAGFIGSNLLEALLKLNQRVIGLDNLSTGYESNLKEVKRLVTEKQWESFRFIKGDIRDLNICYSALSGRVDYVLHQAALGSVPRSIVDPIATNDSNIDGFLNMLVAARDNKVLRFVYASSSSVYGDQKELPKIERRIGHPLSPYAVTKLVNEIYAEVFTKNYKLNTIGLRYFNVFGQRQDTDGNYAAVIPKWINAMLKNEPVFINGDGKTSRDFCYVDNVVQANLLAATVVNPSALNQVYNVAVGEQVSLNDLYFMLRKALESQCPYLKDSRPIYLDFRAGDVRHSLADITKIKKMLGYDPYWCVDMGLAKAMQWYSSSLLC